jgi:hypothetical protein
MSATDQVSLAEVRNMPPEEIDKARRGAACATSSRATTPAARR